MSPQPAFEQRYVSQSYFSNVAHTRSCPAFSLGKYWLVKGPSGEPTQRYYHLPNDLLRFGAAQSNTLVLSDEMGAPEPSAARVVISRMQ